MPHPKLVATTLTSYTATSGSNSGVVHGSRNDMRELSAEAARTRGMPRGRAQSVRQAHSHTRAQNNFSREERGVSHCAPSATWPLSSLMAMRAISIAAVLTALSTPAVGLRVGGGVRSLDGATLSRRAILAAPFAVAFSPRVALAEEEDKLVSRLISVRQKLDESKPALAAGEWDEVRVAVRAALAPLTIKGYLGDSVKARALAAGDKGAALKAERADLLRQLSGVDQYCYEQQSGANPSPADTTKAKEQLEGAVKTLDDVIRDAKAAAVYVK